MLRNNLFNLMNQLVEESKSLWRIKNEYSSEAVGSDDIMNQWKKMEAEKIANIEALKNLIKKYNA